MAFIKDVDHIMLDVKELDVKITGCFIHVDISLLTEVFNPVNMLLIAPIAINGSQL